MNKTAMGAALERAGIDADENDFLAVTARCFNNGLAFERLLLLLRQAYGLPGEGQFPTADEGQCRGADARQPQEDGAGHHRDASVGLAPDARPSSQVATGAANVELPQGQTFGAVPVRAHTRPWPTPKEPSSTDIAAMKSVRQAYRA